MLIAAVNASNFTRLISLSLAVPARSESEDGRAGMKEEGRGGGRQEGRGEEGGGEKKESSEMIILQYKSATYRITRRSPSVLRARPCRVGVGPRGD